MTNKARHCDKLIVTETRIYTSNKPDAKIDTKLFDNK